METRELYRQKYEAQLRELGATFDVVKARVDKQSAESKLEMKPKLDAIHLKYELAKAKLAAMAETADDKWDEFVKGADEAWEDFKASCEGAYDAVKEKVTDKKDTKPA